MIFNGTLLIGHTRKSHFEYKVIQINVLNEAITSSNIWDGITVFTVLCDDGDLYMYTYMKIPCGVYNVLLQLNKKIKM